MSENYLFECGNTPALSFLELQRLTSQMEGVDSSVQSERHVLFTGLDEADAIQLAQKSGGTTKVLRTSIALDHGTDLDTITTHCIEALTTAASAGEKISFAIGEYGRDHLEPLSPRTFKQLLVAAGHRARFLETKRSGANAAQLKYNSTLQEIQVIQARATTYIAQTIWAQDPDEWARRDRNKPYADGKKGMLPPKVARMMVNCATRGEKHLVIDPFCGTGTVLIEALDLGHEVQGSDQDAKSVTGTRQNLEWFDSTRAVTARITHLDASKLTPPSTNLPIAIVTEPFLGKPNPKPDQIKSVIKGLEKLYLGAAKNWSKWLPSGSVMCMVVPAITRYDGDTEGVIPQKFIDKLPELGYTTPLEPVRYFRREAQVHRLIYQFEKE